MNEIWKDIPGYEGRYQASDQGRVRSMPKLRVLKASKASRGYLIVTLYRSGEKTTHSLHRLITGAFLGADDRQVNHIDGNKLNNWLSNLELVNNKQNHQHASALGLKPRGEHNGNSKLTEAAVREIKTLLPKFNNTELARMVGVSRHTIRSIRRGETWAQA